MIRNTNGKKTFAVYTIGLNDSERKVLANIFKLSLYRTRAYALATLDSDLEQPVDIAIIDADGHDAPDQWSLFQTHYPQVPSVWVSQEPPSAAQTYCVRRPFMASRVLAMLDQVSIREHKFMPENVIGAASVPTANQAQLLQQALADTETDRINGKQQVALVVDDSLPVRKQIEIELKLLGIKVDFAETGEQAVKYLNHKAYDIIFLDVVLPGVDGYRVCKTIKKSVITKRTPVVMLTSKASPFDRVRGTFAGCDTYLTKPVAHEAFQDVVRKYLG